MGEVRPTIGVGTRTMDVPVVHWFIRLMALMVALPSLRRRASRPATGRSGIRNDRRERRVRFDGPVTLVQGPLRIRATSSDLSEGGAFIRTRQPPGVGSRVQLTLRLDGRLVLTTPALVRWIRVDERHRPIGCGIAFENLSEPTRAEIRRLVASLDRAHAPGPTGRPKRRRPARPWTSRRVG